jgi:hypothetical protein
VTCPDPDEEETVVDDACKVEEVVELDEASDVADVESVSVEAVPLEAVPLEELVVSVVAVVDPLAAADLE